MPSQQMIAADGGDVEINNTADADSASSSSGSGMGSYGMAAQGSGDLISGIGGLYAGAMESAALNAQANIQNQNAQLDLEAGNSNAARSQIISGQKIGSIQSAAGGSGVTQSGSVLSIMAASSMNAEMDRQNILHGEQVKAIQSENQASMDQAGAQSALNGSYFKAIGGAFESVVTLAALA